MSAARSLTVAHQKLGECRYCDERHAAVVAAVAHELVQIQRQGIEEIMERWGGYLHQDMLSELIDLIDPEAKR